MRRTLAVAALLASLPLGASADGAVDGRPTPVDTASVQKQADDLHDAVASPSASNGQVRDQAGMFFEGLQRETPVVRAHAHFMDREPVTGERGTIEGMLDTAQARYDHYKLKTSEIPAAELDGAIAYARKMREEKREDFDRRGAMPENQMGVFRYAKEKLEGGMIEVNGRMALIATRIGMAFSYATIVHEAAHAKARAEGRLDPKRVIDGEVEAYRVQYRWLKIVDPKEERLMVLHVTLSKYLEQHPDDRITAQAISYVSHLIDLYDTGGEDSKIREYVQKLGYEEGDHDHDGGVNPSASPVRA